MKPAHFIVTFVFMLITAAALGQNGVITVRATVVGSVRLEVQAADKTTAGAGSATYTAALGELSAMQSAPSGFTLSRNPDSAMLATNLQTRALKANLPNVGYTLVARLQRPAPSGISWRVNGVTVSADAASAVTSGTFGKSDTIHLQIEVNDSAATSPLDNAIVFAVVPN